MAREHVHLSRGERKTNTTGELRIRTYYQL